MNEKTELDRLEGNGIISVRTCFRSGTCWIAEMYFFPWEARFLLGFLQARIVVLRKTTWPDSERR